MKLGKTAQRRDFATENNFPGKGVVTCTLKRFRVRCYGQVFAVIIIRHEYIE